MPTRTLPRLIVPLSFSVRSLLCGCQESEPEPAGPLLITRLTLLDASSRDAAVFTDTASPSDCSAAAEIERCQADPFQDRYSPRRSPPTPDSGQDLRVVFNKLPL